VHGDRRECCRHQAAAAVYVVGVLEDLLLTVALHVLDMQQAASPATVCLHVCKAVMHMGTW
jgi:uncharacterized membrane protein